MLGIRPYPAPPERPDAPEIIQPPKPMPITSPTKIESSQDYHSLTELAEGLKNFQHPIKQYGQSFVFSDGDPESHIMLIGEAPGEQEDIQQKPFVGKSGQLLTRIFQMAGYTRKQLYITNIVPWRPPKNRTPSATEIQAFTPFARHHVRLAQPKIVILVGSTPLQAFFGMQYGGITRTHGQWLPLSIDKRDIPCMPIFHPAYLLRNPSRKKDVWFDVLAMRAKLLSL